MLKFKNEKLFYVKMILSKYMGNSEAHRLSTALRSRDDMSIYCFASNIRENENITEVNEGVKTRNSVTSHVKAIVEDLFILKDAERIGIVTAKNIPYVVVYCSDGQLETLRKWSSTAHYQMYEFHF